MNLYLRSCAIVCVLYIKIVGLAYLDKRYNTKNIAITLVAVITNESHHSVLYLIFFRWG